MISSYVDVYIVDANDFIGTASDRILYELPNGGLGIDYGSVIKEVYRSTKGNLVADLSREIWKKEHCNTVQSYHSNDFKIIDSPLENTIENHLLESVKKSFSVQPSASESSMVLDKDIDLFPSNLSADENKHQVFDEFIVSFSLTVRSVNALGVNELHTIRDVVSLTESELIRVPNLGRKSVVEIKTLVTSLGLFLGMTTHDISNYIVDGPSLSSPFDTNDNTVLKLPVGSLILSIRCSNCLQSAKIFTIGDLVKVSRLELIRIPNLGKGSISELEESLLALGLSFGMTYRAIRIYDAESRNLPNDSSINEENLTTISNILFPLRTTMEDWILDLLPNKRLELIKRITAQVTLEQMGHELGVTRERIRQMEAKYKREFRKSWTHHVAEINLLDLDPTEPTYVFMLPLCSKYFENIQKYIPNGKSFFAELFEDEASKYRIECIDHDLLVVHRDALIIQDVVNTIEQLGLTNDYSDYLTVVNRQDLRDYIPKYLEEKLPVSKAGLIVMHLRAIFDDSSKPLSTSKIKEILFEQYALETHSNEIFTASKNLGDIYSFGARSWGMESKFVTLSKNEITIIGGLAVDFLKSSGEVDVHVDILLKTISRLNHPVLISMTTRLDKYQLNWVLCKLALSNSKVIDKKRFLWSYGFGGKRKNLMSIAIDILHNNGGPMTTRELKKLIASQRSLGRSFQLRPNKEHPDLVLLDNNRWGLRNRDLKSISKEMESLFISKVMGCFQSGIPIINSQKLNEIMREIGLDRVSSFFQVSRLLLCYMSTNIPASKILVVYLSKSDTDSVLVVDPQFKGSIPTI
jgi:hypothetical protein